ncbi:hypothetical protein [Burkholderia multivorans]|uniref:hypothetical protein n=1 Tax=Burkholderia multivorans TaxID=87883 RepID=UPI001C25DAAA|nr:hypothetical protein [Burkholderia multivorans]MBU9345656.1 hypothetical protein [Burkholderia multivorans]MCL4652272.1 hypothetical protein [Burkholderia multivorans]MCL4654500.1 hypothetical protein [Burkholderia multivorans]MCO1426781.1 hypothetical protein [Burkholderia multivorans]UQN53569.1 hypothetical protein L0Y88_05630 [Burkholderia multivorans]
MRQFNQNQSAQSAVRGIVGVANGRGVGRAAEFDVNMYIGIPAEVRSLLNVPAVDRTEACNIGALCAALLAKHLRDEPALAGSNRVGAVIERMKGLGGEGGYEAGLFAVLEHLIVEGAKRVNPDALAIRSLAAVARTRSARRREVAAVSIA